MLDHQAAVHHDPQAGPFRTAGAVLIDALELGPGGARAGGDDVVTVTRSVPRQARMFTTKTTVDFINSPEQGRTVMELVAADRPGLLSKIGQTFIKQGVDIQTAKIMTIGERAEDIFYITDESGSPLDDDAQQRLRRADS